MTEIIEVNKYYFFREILRNISSNTGEYLISNIRVNENDLSYDLVNPDNEISVTMMLEGDVATFPKITEIVVTAEHEDVVMLNNLKKIWEG